MPGSGANILWDETAPADSANAGGGAGAIRSLETSIRNGLAVEHSWPNATGPNFGYHLPGSARAYFDLNSNVSSTGTDGRIMVASDTSRFYHVGSGGTMLLGNALGAGVMPLPNFTGGVALAQTHYWAMDGGTVTTDVNGNGTVGFGSSGFSGTPYVFGICASPVLGIVTVASATPTGAVLNLVNASGVVWASKLVNWFSIGSRSLANT